MVPKTCLIAELINATENEVPKPTMVTLTPPTFPMTATPSLALALALALRVAPNKSTQKSTTLS